MHAEFWHDLRRTFREMIDLAELQAEFTISFAPDFSEIFRWLHQSEPHQPDAVLTRASSNILDDESLPFYLLPSWGVEFYRQKINVHSLFERHSTSAGYEKFSRRHEVKRFLECFRADRTQEFARDYRDYWREFTDYLRYFSDSERENIWANPIDRFLHTLRVNRMPDEYQEAIKGPPPVSVDFYRQIWKQLSGSRVHPDKWGANEIDALSAACIHYLNVRSLKGEDQDFGYLVAFTGSRHPLRVYEANPIKFEGRRLRLVVSPETLESYRRLIAVYSASASVDFKSLSAFLKHGQYLVEEVSPHGLDRPPTTEYKPHLAFEQEELVLNYLQPGLGWRADIGGPMTWSDSDQEKACAFHDVVEDEKVFTSKMKDVAHYTKATIEGDDFDARYREASSVVNRLLDHAKTSVSS